MKTENQPVQARLSEFEECRQLQREYTQLIGRVRAAIPSTGDPRFAALLETSAEVLGGLRTALQHYGAGGEEAWTRSPV